MKTFFINYFPFNKKEFKYYSLKIFPIVFGAIFFSLNNFIDNFMVTQIPGGTASLGYANAWTSIVAGFNIAIAGVAALFVGQYYGTKNYKLIKEVVHLRILMGVFIAIIFGTVAWTIPKPFLNVFSHNNDLHQDQTNSYLQIIAISWILMAITFNTGNLLRETGHGKASFISTLCVLFTNIIFNSIFLYALNLGVVGAAWASVISRVFALFLNNFLAWKYERPLMINFLKIYQISKPIYKQIEKRFFAIIISVIAISIVSFRASFWNAGYPQIGNANFYITGQTVLGLTSALTNIMAAGVQSINGGINYFVGRHLGRSEIQIAKDNSKKLIGFNFFIGLILSLLTICIGLILSNISYFGQGVWEDAYNKNLLASNNKAAAIVIADAAKSFYLNELLKTILTISLFSPSWMVLITALRIVNSGGRSNLTSIWNLSLGLMQLGFQAILVFVIVKHSPFVANNLFFGLFLFFSTDILKMFANLFLWKKVNWSKDINIEYNQIKNRIDAKKNGSVELVDDPAN